MRGLDKMLKIEEIKELMKTLEASDLDLLKYKTEDCTLVLKKTGNGYSSDIVSSCTVPQTMKASADKSAAVSAGSGLPEEKIVEVAAPSVGTFYQSANPGAEPFVQVGSKVQENTVVCILEAMKLFTEVEAEAEGEIVEVLVKDGSFVEYGQPLFKIKTV